MDSEKRPALDNQRVVSLVPTMFTRLCITLAILTGFARSAPLAPAKEAELRAQFQARQSETKTWAANFSQTLAMPGMAKPVESSGSLAYRAPNQLRMDFTKPEGEFVLVNRDALFIQKAGKRVSEKSLTRDTAGRPFLSLLGLLRGQPPEEESMYAAEISREDGKYILVLNRKPEASTRAPKRITNIIDADSLEIREVLVELPNGGTLRYAFSGVIRNRAIPDERFAEPPTR
jgi:outer membrane lipoprotein-sorting protein